MIGIVGQISVQKGALVVKELLARIDRDHPDIRVVVIGDARHRDRSRTRLRVTGTYRREDLVDLIEANGINLFFFPSICPETFSYVTEEMIRLGAADRRVRPGRAGRAPAQTTPTRGCASEVAPLPRSQR